MAIVAFVIAWLSSNIEGVNVREYSINTLDELCQNEVEIFNSDLAIRFYDAQRNLALSNVGYPSGTMIQESSLNSEYAQKIREDYDVNPVLLSDIIARLQGVSLNC